MSQANQISRRIAGQYERKGLLGSGGMAKVYLCWDCKYDRTVAVKILHTRHLNNEEFVRLFKAEADMIAQLSHQNIVTLYDAGQEADQDGMKPYIVMEYVPGITLLKLMIKERNHWIKDSRDAVRIVLKILAALEHAHDHNIAHLDIKPQNILVSDDRKKIKVTDFGISRMINGTTSSKTEEGNVLGSAYYFSPEQASGKAVDGRSDLYSVGVVLYEMVTGRKPFEGEKADEVASKHVYEAPPAPSSINPEISKGMEEVILKALRKDPEKRYQKAEEFINDLKMARRYPEGGFIEDRKRRSVKRGEKNGEKSRTWITVVFALLITALLAVGGVYGWKLYERMQMRVQVPDLIMADVDDAQAQLEQQGLLADIILQYHDQVITGMVFDQVPGEGMLLYPGEQVSLYVSRGKEAISVPNVSLIGLSRSDAEEVLMNAGLTCGEIILEISEEKVGTVVRQQPAADEMVQPFTEVVLYVSGECAAVPKLDGLTVELARSTLAASGFVLGDVYERLSEVEPGLVIAQSIPEGQQALIGDGIDITISQVIPESYYAEAAVTVQVEKDGDEIICMLTDGEGNTREVYRDTADAGEQIINLNLDSYVQGEHTLSVYIRDELFSEKQIDFK